MDFENVNPLNVQLNMISGNLLPTTGNDSPFPIVWKIYSIIVWLIWIAQIVSIIAGIMFVPREKALQDATVCMLVATEELFLFTRMQAHRNLASRLIKKLNEILHVKDETMRNVVVDTLKPFEIPLKIYWIGGSVSLIGWLSTPLALVFTKKLFFYEDYRMPAVFSKQPFPIDIFVLGTFIEYIASVLIFTKKVALDVYTINFLLLMTVQYRYISVKLASIFEVKTALYQQEELKKNGYINTDSWAEKEMRALCQHYNTVINITSMLKKLLSLNFSVIYLTNVFRFCFLDAMMVIAIPSAPIMECFMIVMYTLGGLTQLFIICLCVNKLLDASTEITDVAFHEKWYQFGPSLKHKFLLMIMGNNLECKLATFEKFNLSLSSFMAILNQSYSVALLFLRIH